MKLRAGELRESLTFIRPSGQVDADVGGETGAPVVVFANVPAKRAPMTSYQRIETGAAKSVTQKLFWIRWLDGIDPSMWVIHDGVTHTIVAIDEMEHREVLVVKAEVRNDATA